MKPALSEVDWTNLRTFLLVAEHGNAAAADRLGVDATTVRRRLAVLQASIGLPLFFGSGRTRQLTPEGERIRGITLKMAELSHEISQNATDAARDVVGVVRISTMEGFASFFLAPRLGEFTAKYPKLRVELVASQTILNLSEREADLSINMVRPQHGRLMVRRAGEFGVGLYGAPSYVARAGFPDTRKDLERFEFVTYVDELISVPHVRWLPDVTERPRTTLSFTSLTAQLAAAEAGAGLVMLPHFMTHGNSKLVRLLAAEVNLVRDWWLVVHQDLQRVPRIRAAIDFIIEIMRRDRSVMMGPSNLIG
ncbi:LysR family transcriptional regulator [Sinorhizobium americanum]|uniref:LysR family transcriptional regulator n=1 Tax=Sinorhizobium americanum TaxID=194963 RepID=UPI0007DA279D|nr:LysR family transcriptional regulator [Sinorhizobium americanum]OAP35890.1 hypothetical protein ATC00_22185 [Sinorhizobium americanum]